MMVATAAFLVESMVALFVESMLEMKAEILHVSPNHVIYRYFDIIHQLACLVLRLEAFDASILMA